MSPLPEQLSADLRRFADLVPLDHGLAVVAVTRPDGTVHASVTNAGVLAHPLTGTLVVGIVTRGGTRKLHYLHTHARTTVVLRAGWKWAAVEGTAELAGPDDPLAGVDTPRLRMLLREIFTAAGGQHDDWDTYDQTMAAERRTAVLVTPERVLTNR
ncbi:MAG: pyridoxamine 5'-phosphate oxidase [Pseudonocardiales bacterium]|nr:pyridoxamine 5'-phosphate oxidase [Pseudonocardiales bacterium]PZS27935.1 MAG: pyridoxamine 5'-phosphate oxidase [Pseudonocardiales bacterium]